MGFFSDLFKKPDKIEVPGRPDYLKQIEEQFGGTGLEALDLFKGALPGTIEDIDLESLQLGASPYEEQVGDIIMQMLGSGRGLSDEQLNLEREIQGQQDLRSRENMQSALQDAMFGAQKLGVTTGGQLSGISGLAEEQSRIAAEQANQYKLGTMNEDFRRMSEATGRGLGLAALTGAREEGNINRQYQEEQNRRTRPYQLLSPITSAIGAGQASYGQAAPLSMQAQTANQNRYSPMQGLFTAGLGQLTGSMMPANPFNYAGGSVASNAGGTK